MPDDQLNAILDVGVETWHELLMGLENRGIAPEFGSSVLAVAVAGAITFERISVEEFLSIVMRTLSLWKLEDGAEGPVLVFNRALVEGPSRRTPDEPLAACAGN